MIAARFARHAPGAPDAPPAARGPPLSAATPPMTCVPVAALSRAVPRRAASSAAIGTRAAPCPTACRAARGPRAALPAPRAGDYFTVDRAGDVAVVRIDDKSGKVNTLNQDMMGEFARVLDSVESDEGVKAAVLVSGKADSFIAGADISMLDSAKSEEEAIELAKGGQVRAQTAGAPPTAADHVPRPAAHHGQAGGQHQALGRRRQRLLPRGRARSRPRLVRLPAAPLLHASSPPPASTASPPPPRRPGWASPKCSWACCPARGALSGCHARSGSRSRSWCVLPSPRGAGEHAL